MRCPNLKNLKKKKEYDLNKQTDRQTDTQTDGQTDRQISVLFCILRAYDNQSARFYDKSRT